MQEQEHRSLSTFEMRRNLSGERRPFSCVLLLLDEEFFFAMSLNHRFHRCSKYFPHQIFLSQKKSNSTWNKLTNPTPRICQGATHTHTDYYHPGEKDTSVAYKLSLEALHLDWELPLWEPIQVELLPERKWSLSDLSTRCHKGIRKLTTKWPKPATMSQICVYILYLYTHDPKWCLLFLSLWKKKTCHESYLVFFHHLALQFLTIFHLKAGTIGQGEVNLLPWSCPRGHRHLIFDTGKFGLNKSNHNGTFTMVEGWPTTSACCATWRMV